MTMLVSCKCWKILTRDQGIVTDAELLACTTSFSFSFLLPCNWSRIVYCRQTSYNTAVTTSTWPSDQYWVRHPELSSFTWSLINGIFLALKRDIALELGHPKDLLEDADLGAEIKTDIQSDYAKANIYIRTLDVQSIKESPKYTVCPQKKFVQVAWSRLEFFLSWMVSLPGSEAHSVFSWGSPSSWCSSWLNSWLTSLSTASPAMKRCRYRRGRPIRISAWPDICRVVRADRRKHI